MAAVVGKLLRNDRVRKQLCFVSQKIKFSSFSQFSRSTRKIFYTSCLALVGAAGVAYALKENVKPGELIVHPTKHPWSENGIFSILDHARITFLKQVHATSPNKQFIHYCEFQNISQTEEEAEKRTDHIKTLCEKVVIEDKEMWTLYKKAFNRNYDASEELERKLLFEKSLVFVLYQNYEYSIGKKSSSAGLNQFSDWTRKEYRDILFPQ